MQHSTKTLAAVGAAPPPCHLGHATRLHLGRPHTAGLGSPLAHIIATPTPPGCAEHAAGCGRWATHDASSSGVVCEFIRRDASSSGVM
eukprot:6323065-Prymnesium_polylepis.1